MPSPIWGPGGEPPEEVQDDDGGGPVLTHIGFVETEQLAESYHRALGGGLIDPSTGDASLVDSDGDFYEDGRTYEGSPLITDVAWQGASETGERGAEAAGEVVQVLPAWLKAGVVFVVLGVALYLLRPLLEIGANLSEEGG